VRRRIKTKGREHRFERAMVNRACRQSSHDFSHHHGPPMNGQRRGEPWTAELSNDIEDASLVSRLPYEA
jgi:hypothetical protein